MSLFLGPDRAFAEVVDSLIYENPFSAGRLALERRALETPDGSPTKRGKRHRVEVDAWTLGPGHTNPLLAPLGERTARILSGALPRLSDASEEDVRLYGGLARFSLYYAHEPALLLLARQAEEAGFRERKVELYHGFARQLRRLVPSEAMVRALFRAPSHLFALSFQLRRTFDAIFEHIVGASRPTQAHRARIWQSVFTHDMRRYERSLFDRMHEVNTLIVGESGTGKELVARALARSRYLPFDERRECFADDLSNAFVPLNVAALPAALVESELFGHKKGSFTGATTDRIGWLESCSSHGTVFLDEVGELSADVQVKLLRTLQSREFSRVGEQRRRHFTGKLVTATNRDLAREIDGGRFRVDFFHRLRGDVVETPPLRAQLAERPEDLELLVASAARRLVPPSEMELLVRESCDFIRHELPEDYAWPGNVRELEQCLRSVLVTGRYVVPAQAMSREEAAGVGARFVDGDLDFEAAADLFVTLGHKKYGSYSETARRLGLDRRTVKARVRPELLKG
jgi:DNA-binding NtrC family response regulator